MIALRVIEAASRDQIRYFTQDKSLIEECRSSNIGGAELSDSAIWMGAEAKHQDLTGSVARADLELLMSEGRLPRTVQRIRGGCKTIQEKVAFDLTLSVPKHLLLNIQRDSNLLDAQIEAAGQTIVAIERSVFPCEGGTFVAGEKLIAAALTHWGDRRDVGVLHTHLLIMNGTHDTSSKWKAIDPRPLMNLGWINRFYESQLMNAVQAASCSSPETESTTGR